MKNFIKKCLSFAVLSMVVFPVHVAYAAHPLSANRVFTDFGDSTSFGDSTGALLQNVANAESVEFSVDIDVETMNDQLEKPVTAHIDVDGASNAQGDLSLAAALVSTDSDGVARNAGGSVIKIGNMLYLSETGGEWYFIEGESITLTEGDVDTGVAEMEALMSDLLDRGVITYDIRGPAYVHDTWTLRYAYDVDIERFIDYLVDVGRLSEVQADKLRETGFDGVDIGGNLWIDPSEMLPVKFTVHIAAFEDASSYTTFDASVLFRSFNEPVNIHAPAHAVSFADADFSDTEEVVASSFDLTIANMDTDGDGLTNVEEETVWYSNPLSNDTDGDGYLDYTEVVNGYNPNGVGKLDSDGDGLTDYAETTLHWTDRFDSDSDNDGYADGVEIANGYNPNGTGRW
jgi:hypothetical protein